MNNETSYEYSYLVATHNNPSMYALQPGGSIDELAASEEYRACAGVADRLAGVHISASCDNP